MGLQELYQLGGRPALNALALAAKANAKYLYQIATGRKPNLSVTMARRLIAADSRLTMDKLVPAARDQSAV